MGRLREIRRLRRRVRIGAPDPPLTLVSEMAAVTELVDRLGMIKLLDAAIGPIKARDRGFTGGQLLVGVAAAQLAGEDFLVGLQSASPAGCTSSPRPPDPGGKLAGHGVRDGQAMITTLRHRLIPGPRGAWSLGGRLGHRPQGPVRGGHAGRADLPVPHPGAVDRA